ncbi:hypothetical protein J2T10_002758 [Paenarthrobacter nicotinovorans]|jgi:hypothetical protein|uniref:Uncharacterized protein n=1 Tax=Paenarthrobacter nicotinovorans TaxID=29320 RepID=A0ABT9TN80_PAENI|nr:hypothetical protein [Paenarthrobacter nicotinovorans]MDQ0103101.1 hypothetical protein [Paenarthrobacter nicotinovorans]GAT88428.1 hypothetical protein CVCC1112_3087 [Paenarthrobacter nicotinovorans]
MNVDAAKLAGMFVVEVGTRQAWPFIGFCDDTGNKAREFRLYIDARWTMGDKGGDADSHETWMISALETNNRTVSKVQVDAESNLRIDFFNATSLAVSGEPTATTVGDPWWLGELSG